MSFEKSIKELCRELRKRQTPSEEILWEHLRNRKLKGLKFLRQHPIVYDRFTSNVKFFIADFYCAEKEIVIELDGKVHDAQKDYDKNRDEIIESRGIKVIRFKNDETKEMKQLLEKIAGQIG